MSLTFPIQAKLKDGSPVQLLLAGERDIEPLRALYRIIVDEGTSYPHDRFPDQDDFLDYWFRQRLPPTFPIVRGQRRWPGPSI